MERIKASQTPWTPIDPANNLLREKANTLYRMSLAYTIQSPNDPDLEMQHPITRKLHPLSLIPKSQPLKKKEWTSLSTTSNEEAPESLTLLASQVSKLATALLAAEDPDNQIYMFTILMEKDSTALSIQGTRGWLDTMWSALPASVNDDEASIKRMVALSEIDYNVYFFNGVLLEESKEDEIQKLLEIQEAFSNPNRFRSFLTSIQRNWYGDYAVKYKFFVSTAEACKKDSDAQLAPHLLLLASRELLNHKLEKGEENFTQELQKLFETHRIKEHEQLIILESLKGMLKDLVNDDIPNDVNNYQQLVALRDSLRQKSHVGDSDQ